MTVVESVNGKSGVVTLTAANVEAIPDSEAGAANGVATLNSSGKLPEGQLPSSVANGSPTAQSIFVGNGTAWEKLPVGASGQQMIVRSDGTIGYEDNEINLRGWAVGSNAELGNGTHDDTAAIQEWVAAVIAKNAKGVAPAPSSTYSVSKAIYMGPPVGQVACSFSLEWQGAAAKGSTVGPGCIKWTGASGTDGAREAMFQCYGWKRCSIRGLKPRIESATYVTVFEIDNPCTTFTNTVASGTAAGTSIAVGTTKGLIAGQHLELSGTETLTVKEVIDGTHLSFTEATAHEHLEKAAIKSLFESFSQSSFYDVHVTLPGEQAGVIGWRMGHTSSADISFLAWYNCEYDAGASTGNTGSTAQIGWANESGNGLNLYWYGGDCLKADKVLVNTVTTGGANSAGGGALFVYGLGTSGTGVVEYEFVNRGTYLISGGRYEGGKQFLSTGIGAIGVGINIRIEGVECEGYSGASGVFIDIAGSVILTLENCFLGATSAEALWGADMIKTSSGSDASRGSIIVRGCHIAAGDPCITFSVSDWAVEVMHCVKLSTANGAEGVFKDNLWLSTNDTRDGLYISNGTPGSNIGVTCFIHMGAPGLGESPRARFGYNGAVTSSSGTGGVIFVNDADSDRDIVLSTSDSTATQLVRAKGGIEAAIQFLDVNTTGKSTAEITTAVEALGVKAVVADLTIRDKTNHLYLTFDGTKWFKSAAGTEIP
jgi:hypothetical protein